MAFNISSARYQVKAGKNLAAAVGFTVASLFIFESAAAQQESLTLQQALQFCANIADEDERLDCFEALADTAGEKTASTKAGPKEAAEPGQEVEVADAAGTDEADAPDKEKNSEGKKGFRLPFIGRKDKPASVEVTEDEGAKEESRFIIRRADAPEEKRRNRETYQATVYKAWRNGAGELRVAFRSGEIWRETDQSMDYDPQPGEIAEFRPRVLGAWLVYFEDGGEGIAMTKMN